MDDLKLCDSEYRFMLLVWEAAPVRSGELVRLASDRLGWKKSTTYTVLKRLRERGLFKSENGVVTALVSREDYYSARSEHFVEETFDGSLPAFLAAFTSRKKLSQKEIDELQDLIDKMRG